MSKYEIYLTRKAEKTLNKLSKNLRKRILKALTTLREYGFTRKLHIKKLKGYKNHYRLRIGEYKVF